MNDFTFYVPTKVHFGKGQIKELNNAIKTYGNCVLLVYGGGSIKANGIYDQVLNELMDCKIIELAGVNPNPRIESVVRGVSLCREYNVDVILSVGGGSCIDCSKAIAGARYYEGDAWDIILDASKIKKALPIVDIITLSATSSEMNCTGVVSNLDVYQKLGFKNELLFPKVSIMDPTYTYSVPKEQSAAGTADIMSHVFEIYFNDTQGAYLQEELSHSVLKTCIKYGPKVLDEPKDYEARANLMWGATLALNTVVGSGFAKTWSCHAMEHVLSAYYDVTHGCGLAILTPQWMRYILDEKNVSRFVKYGVNVWEIDENLDDFTIAKMAIDKTEQFFHEQLGLPLHLSDIGVEAKMFDEMAQNAVQAKGGIIKGFKALNKEDVVNIYRMCK